MSNGDGVTNVSHCAGLFFSHALGEIIRQGYGMAMMWDIENGYKDGQDHGMFASSKEPNVDWLNPHPSFYHYYYYNKCFGDTYYESHSTSKLIRIHTSTFSSGEIGIVAINISSEEEVLSLNIKNKNTGNIAGVFELSSDSPSSRKVAINSTVTNKEAGGPQNFLKIKANKIEIRDNNLKLNLKPYSANYIVIEND